MNCEMLWFLKYVYKFIEYQPAAPNRIAVCNHDVPLDRALKHFTIQSQSNSELLATSIG